MEAQKDLIFELVNLSLHDESPAAADSLRRLLRSQPILRAVAWERLSAASLWQSPSPALMNLLVLLIPDNSLPVCGQPFLPVRARFLLIVIGAVVHRWRGSLVERLWRDV